jgi:hypothetical protein
MYILGIKLKDSLQIDLQALSMGSLKDLLIASTEATLTTTSHVDILSEDVNANSNVNMNSCVADHCVFNDGEHDNKSVYSDSTESSDFSIVDNEYYRYSRIESHMNISMSLYSLNKEGQDILKELEHSKLHVTSSKRRLSNNEQHMSFPKHYGSAKHLLMGTPSPSRDVDRDVQCIGDMNNSLIAVYQVLNTLINYNRMNYDTYVELLNILDNVLFDECDGIEEFFVKESSYSLESMYYKQDTWIPELEWYSKPPFIFKNDKHLDLGENSYLLLYFNRYIGLMDMIQSSFDNTKVKDVSDKIKSKLHSAINVVKDNVMFQVDDDCNVLQ